MSRSFSPIMNCDNWHKKLAIFFVTRKKYFHSFAHISRSYRSLCNFLEFFPPLRLHKLPFTSIMVSFQRLLFAREFFARKLFKQRKLSDSIFSIHLMYTFSFLFFFCFLEYIHLLSHSYFLFSFFRDFTVILM